MLEQLYEHLDALLAEHGEIINVLLHSERSLFLEEETLQMELYFSSSDKDGLPLATIHLFPIDEETCEVEVEIRYDQLQEERDPATLWRQAQAIVAEVSYSENKRYLNPEQLAEHTLQLDYHFVLSLPRNEQEAEEINQLLGRFAIDLGKLVRL